MPKKKTMIKKLSKVAQQELIFSTEESYSDLPNKCKTKQEATAPISSSLADELKTGSKVSPDISEKLQLMTNYLCPIIEEIVSKTSNLTEEEILNMERNNEPLCKIPTERFSEAFKASELLQELSVQLNVSENKKSKLPFLDFFKSNFIVNTLYYPDGNTNEVPLDFERYIYIDKNVMNGLIELQKLLRNIVAQLGLAVEDPEERMSTKYDLDDSKITSIAPSNSTTHIKKSKHDSTIDEAKRKVHKCLMELSVIREFLENQENEDVDLTAKVQLSADPKSKECCQKSNIPHVHAKLNGIPVILKLDITLDEPTIPDIKLHKPTIPDRKLDEPTKDDIKFDNPSDESIKTKSCCPSWRRSTKKETKKAKTSTKARNESKKQESGRHRFCICQQEEQTNFTCPREDECVAFKQ